MSGIRQLVGSNPVGDILVAVPEFQELHHVSTRNEVANFIERKLKKFTLKLKASPYDQNSPNDPFEVNTNFGEALRGWLLQFPEKHRLGFLAAALSTIYITDAEIDSFIDISLSRLREEITEAVEKDAHQMRMGPVTDWGVLVESIRCCPISLFGAYDKVIRKLQISGSRDLEKQPVRGAVDALVRTKFQDLRVLADRDLQTLIYRDEAAQRIVDLVHSFRGSHIVLVEDGTFSGKRITREARHFLRLMNVLFSGFEGEMAKHGYKRPWVYVLVVYGTVNALELVKGLGTGPDRVSDRFVPVFGHVFDRDASVNPGPPPAVEELAALIQKAEANKKLRRAVEFFHESYSHRYWREETEMGRMLKLADKELPYGLDGKGWTLLTHVNCPNDSLPLLWYPHVGSPTVNIRPLFPRLESQNEKESMQDLKESMDIVSRDKDRCLHDFLVAVHREP